LLNLNSVKIKNKIISSPNYQWQKRKKPMPSYENQVQSPKQKQQMNIGKLHGAGSTLRETVTVFWDYENCPCPMSTRVSDLVKLIKDTVDNYLEKKLTKRIQLYASINRLHHNTRADFLDSGVLLMDVATKNKLESVDKRIIADIGVFAADLAHSNEVGIIVLISGDSDFGYILSRLRDRSYISKILLFTQQHTRNTLDMHADKVFRVFFPLSSNDNPFSKKIN